jgi:hypothetical protein
MARSGLIIGHDPIEHLADDRLGRGDFAQLLARALAGNPERRSMVVALYGDWGSGKTSVLNLCFEALGKLSQEQQPLVVRFNPWWYSNTGELLAQFFEELGTALEEQAESKGIGALKGIKGKLLSYRKLIAPAGAVADLFISGGALTALATLAQAGVERAAQEQETTADVHEVRDEIEAALGRAEKPVVIAIDDIDRLSASEVRDIFKVVKATADFPNTRYLLAFDFETVSDALAEVQHTDGAAYLEKIVQVPFRLPDPTPGQLMAIVAEGVQEVASGQEEISDEEREQAKERLEYLAFYGLGSLWDNMRRVNRVLDSLHLTLPAVAGEVRLYDFVLLEALRVTEPRVYESILDGKNLLIGATPGAEMMLTRGSRNAQEEVNRATAALVDAVCRAADRKELDGVIRHILEELFPRVGTATGRIGAYGRDRLDEWTNQKRVCVEEYFGIATGWSLSPGAISAAEVQDLVGITDPAELRERLRTYDHDARDGVDSASVLEKIGPFYRTEADPTALEAIVRVVLGEERADRSYPTMFLLVLDALKRLPDHNEKKRILLETIREHRVLPLTADLLKELGKEHGWLGREAYPEQYRTLPPAQLQEVVDAALEDLRKQAEESALLSRDPLGECLYFWRAAAGEGEPAAFLKEFLDDRDSFTTMLRALAGGEAAHRLGEKEPLTDESAVAYRLRLLWVLKLDGEARALADGMLGEEISDEDRLLLEWFVRTHDRANRSIEDE